MGDAAGCRLSGLDECCRRRRGCAALGGAPAAFGLVSQVTTTLLCVREGASTFAPPGAMVVGCWAVAGRSSSHQSTRALSMRGGKMPRWKQMALRLWKQAARHVAALRVLCRPEASGQAIRGTCVASTSTPPHESIAPHARGGTRVRRSAEAQWGNAAGISCSHQRVVGCKRISQSVLSFARAPYA